MANSLTRKEVQEQFSQGILSGIVGLAESAEVDCKREPYPLDSEHGKQELAKDVAGFANADGGLLIIGAVTESASIRHEDIVVDVRPFLEGLVDISRYLSVIDSWIYPGLSGISANWFSSRQDPAKGVVVIDIPAQDKTNWPFLVVRHIGGTGKREEAVFGYFERKRDSVDHLSLQELHALLRDGSRFENLLREEFEEIRTLISHIAVSGQTVRAVQNWIPLSDRIAQSRSVSGFGGEPAYVLAAVPAPPTTIPTLFSNPNAEVVKLLGNPPSIRPSGFDLATYEQAKIVDGKLRRAVLAGDKLLELWQDGVLIFLAHGDNFLCWGNNSRRAQHPMLINQLVLIESSFLFVRLSLALAKWFEPVPKEVTYFLQMRGMESKGKFAGLGPGPLDPYGRNRINRLSGPDLQVEVTAAPTAPADKIAFLLVSKVYELFSFEHDRIPYVDLRDGSEVISEQQIKEIG
jgi:hypothetical protein